MQKKVLSLVLALLLVALLAPAAAGAQDKVFLRYPITVEPEHLNPFTANTIAIGTVLRNIHEGLTWYNPETGDLEPALAESWTISDDKLTYTFNLRRGVLFHQIAGVEYGEGEREVTADVVLWNYKTALNADTNISGQAETLKAIVGAEAFTKGEADEVEGIKVIDPYTLQITLSVPDRLFLYGWGNISITSPVAYEQLGEAFNNTPVGTGPFQFVEWRRNDRIVLEANPDYWREGYPKVDGVRFINYGDANTALLDYRAGELDFLFAFPTGQRAAIREEFAAEYNEKPGLHLRYFGFDMSQGFFFENPLVRQAFNHALNRDLIWNELEEGARFPANLGVLPPAMPASTPSITYPYDLERANELLTEAGFPPVDENDWTKGRVGFPEIKMQVLAALQSELSIPVLQEDLRKLGITLTIEVEEGATYWSHLEEDDVIFFISGWAAGLVDPSDTLDYLFYEGRDSTEYSNPEVNALLDAARVEYDEEARTALYQQAHDLIMADAPVIPSAYSKVIWLQKPWIRDFNPGGGGTYTAPLWLVSVVR